MIISPWLLISFVVIARLVRCGAVSGIPSTSRKYSSIAYGEAIEGSAVKIHTFGRVAL